MQTNENILSRFAEDLKLRDYAPKTQKLYLRIAQEFLEWSNQSSKKLKEENIDEYMVYLKNVRGLNSSTVRVRDSVIRLLFGAITGDEKFYPPPRGKFIKNGCLKIDREKFVKYLLEMEYSPKSLENYKWTINCLERFMTERGLKNYSSDIGKSFLIEVAESGYHTVGVHSMMTYTIRRFDCFKNGGEYIFKMPYTNKECPPQFAGEFAKYIEFLKKKGLKESTIENHRYNLRKAFLKFNEIGLQRFADIKPEVMYDVFEKTSDKIGFCSPARSLLRYLFEMGIVDFDYSIFIPSVRKSHPVPSVYTKAETKKLLNNSEKDSRSNKRNNAIILLALRVGIRSGDITNLKLTDVDWGNKEICFIQEKTEIPQRLALLPEVETALTAYISAARPKSDIPNIFISLKAPCRVITKQAVYSLIRRRFESSDINTGNRNLGGHALRMTLASELVAEKVPYDAVRKILGHEDPVSIKHYVKFDIESLRSCSIEIPPVTGQLAAYMNARLGGHS